MNAFSKIVGLVILGALALLAGCGQSPPSASPPAAVVIPEDWPTEVPIYEGGQLVTATVNADGSAVALWEVTGVPEKKVMGAYHKALHQAGFRTTDWFSDLAETGYVYRGHGLIVRAGTIDVDQSVSLSVDVSCVTDCTVPE